MIQLKAKSSVIAEELKAVLATEELFKGDSRYKKTQNHVQSFELIS